LTAAAIVLAADPEYPVIGNVEPVQVRKLYNRIWSAAEQVPFRSVFGPVAMEFDGTTREWVGWPEWAVSTMIDTAAHWSVVHEAVRCHQSQIGDVPRLAELGQSELRVLWGTQQFFRVFSTVPVENALEVDLFSGLRVPAASAVVSKPAEIALI